LRVLIVTKDFFPHEGGAEVQARRLAGYLGKSDVPVMVVTKREKGLPPIEKFDGFTVYRLSSSIEPLFLISLSAFLLSRRKEFDVVQLVQTQLAALVVAFWNKLILKKVVVVRGSNTGPFFGLNAYWKLIPFGKQLVAFICKNVSAAVGTSPRMVKELKQIGFRPDQVQLIPSGVSLGKQLDASQKRMKRAEIGLGSDDVVALFVGRLTWQKAPDVLIAAWKKVANASVSNKLLIVGKGDLEGSLKKKVADLELEQSVLFVPFTNDIEKYYQVADLFVLPSRYEGFSSAMLDAMSYALPIVVTRVSGTENIVADKVNGLLVNPEDADQLAAQLSQLLSDAKLRVSLGRNARQTVMEEYEMEVVGRNYIALYESLAGHQ
jgi:glycosyltransferase involved in cell wall biosynthesis